MAAGYGWNNFRPGYMPQGAVLGPAVVTNVALTADDQFVNVQGFALLQLYSDNATPANRTFTLSPGNFQGHQLKVIFQSAGTSCQLVNTGNVKLNGDWEPLQYDALDLYYDGTYWVEIGRSDPVFQVAEGTLTNAQLLALNTTPVTVIPAPAAGKAIVIDEVEMFHDYSTAAYTGGGDVSLQYATSNSVVILFADTLVTGNADLKTVARPTIYNLDASTGTATGYDLSNATAQGVELTNASADFGGGNAANILKYRIRYHVVTLLS